MDVRVYSPGSEIKQDKIICIRLMIARLNWQEYFQFNAVQGFILRGMPDIRQSTRKPQHSAIPSGRSWAGGRSMSQDRRTSGRIPSASLPTTSASAPSSRTLEISCASSPASNPMIQTLACFNSDIACARLVATIRRCSLAPEEACTTAGVTPAAPCGGMITPCTPNASAERSKVPRFWGSCSVSSISMKGGSSRRIGGFQNCVQVSIGVGSRLPAPPPADSRPDCPVSGGWPAQQGFSFPGKCQNFSDDAFFFHSDSQQ